MRSSASTIQHCPPIVAICTDQGTHTISVILSLLQCSTCYFYIDPSLQPQQIYSLLDKVKPKYIIFDSITKMKPKLCLEETITLVKSFILLEKECFIYKYSASKSTHVDNGIFSYVISTSGSTGLPKIVYVPQQCLLPNVKDLCSYFDITCSDILFSSAPPSFDPSIVNLLVAVCSGAQLVTASTTALMAPSFITTIMHQRATVIQATPSLLLHWDTFTLLNKSLFGPKSDVRLVALGGEPIPSLAMIKMWFKNRLRTKLFNLYGITEVSSWAMIKQIQWMNQNSNDKFDLGNLLTDTHVCLIDDNNKVILEGEGEIFLGRVNSCDIITKIDTAHNSVIDRADKGTVHNNVKMFPSGDTGYLKDRRVYLIGRKDRNMKIFGNKIALSIIEKSCQNIPFVKLCAVEYLFKQLVCFFVVDKNIDVTFCLAEIRSQLSAQYPVRIFLTDSLPINSHGKINRSMLKYLLGEEDKKNTLGTVDKYKDVNAFCADLKQIVERAWSEYLGRSPLDDSNFLESGGDSIRAVMLMEHLQQLLHCNITASFDSLMHDTFENFLVSIRECVMQSINNNRSNASSSLLSIYSLQESHISIVKRRKTEASKEFADIILSRWNYFLEGVSSVPTEKRFPEDSILLWSHNLLKCIDASPLLVYVKGRKFVFVGSHSSVFCCLDATTGNVVWSKHLSGRIEASPSINRAGTSVYAACYTGVLYSIAVHDGSIAWTFKAEAEIKCSPIVDYSTGNIYFGSHDKNIYCLESDGNLVWQQYHSGGSIFASVCLNDGDVFAVCLRGIVRCYDKLSGTDKWRYNLPLPVFASLVCFSGGILAVSVNHSVYALSYSGQLLWQYLTTDQCYATPRILQLEHREVIAVANNAGMLYIFSSSGSVLSTYQFDSRIFATPFLYRVVSQDLDDFTCVIITCSGIVYFLKFTKNNSSNYANSKSLNTCSSSNEDTQPSCSESSLAYQASVIHVITCSKEIFSSPILHDGRLYTCGRDDIICCYSLRELISL